ncbi:MAG: bifunctional indole-3-glycerol phosphate synthase/phosphoribosylanthranilate isomerase [Fibrobacter sp.]|nr:bifunctional indole-3-glycerol phosphate synthase/phosphoribosylanthranilate isomerase [Fibrobacter sp.]
MSRDILAEIVAKRKADIERLGICFGFERPKRTRPLHPFIAKPGTILEVKRSSPSKGNIAMGLDPVETARKYAEAGTSAISVLTETNYFNGTLSDILKVAEAAPNCAILRKDFLLYPEEVDVAYDFGADAVLLIARILDDSTLCAMANRARELGMTPFVEVRTEDDIRKLKLVQKDGECVAGVNARDLRNFHIDPLIPAAFRKELGPRAVFESGVKEPSDAAFARRLGFEGILIGEAAAKSPDSAKNLVSAFLGASQDGYGKFWKTFAEKREEVRKNFPGKPLVKICGITNEEDAVLATELGADMLGFMFYNPSPRKTNEADTRRIVSRLKEQFKDKAPLCVGVVADRGTAEEKTAFALAKEGVLDAIQFHGVSIPSEMENANFGYYAAVRLKSQAEAESLIANSKHSLPRTLVDAYVPDVVGGTGKRIDDSLLDAVRAKEPLWMAGGISSENISEIVARFEPELVDLSTSLEASHGKKSAEKLRAFFKAVR